MTTAAGNTEPLIRVQNLKKHFPITAGLFRRQVGTVKAVDGISFEASDGRVTGLLGPNGAGKSTLTNIVNGLIDNFNGEVERMPGLRIG